MHDGCINLPPLGRPRYRIWVINPASIHAAAARIADLAVRTPLLSVPGLPGGSVFVKAENLQRTGSFKFRGALNRLRLLDGGARARGVIAYSSGNHGLAVAEAARLCGAPATIVIPADAPQAKRAGIAAAGARIIDYDRGREDREAIAAAIATREALAIIEPFDHPDTIAGQGTCGLEAGEQALALGVRFERLICCCGGGGLIAGVGIALREAFPEIEIIAAEPQGWDDTARSLSAGARMPAPGGPSLCDALMSPMPGAITFAINQRQIAAVAVVSDADVRAAMRFAFARLKLVLEPGGAAAMAALLAGRAAPIAGATLIIASGGNVDPFPFSEALREPG